MRKRKEANLRERKRMIKKDVKDKNLKNGTSKQEKQREHKMEKEGAFHGCCFKNIAS